MRLGPGPRYCVSWAPANLVWRVSSGTAAGTGAPPVPQQASGIVGLGWSMYLWSCPASVAFIARSSLSPVSCLLSIDLVIARFRSLLSGYSSPSKRKRKRNKVDYSSF